MKLRIIIGLCLAIPFMVQAQQYQTLTHNGIERTYRLHLPTGYQPTNSYPLVINMHGLGSNALEQELYTGFNFVSDTGGFIVTYPNAIDEAWNVASTAGIDDVGFISALIDTLSAAYSVDYHRIYATGMSMGGFMSYRLACELEDRIAAIASVTGLLAFLPCDPDRPVPVMQIHGTEDPIVPYSGVSGTVSHWVNHNGCPTTPVVTNLPDTDTTDNSTVTVWYHGLCQESTEVILYTINGGEHTWPGAPIIIGVTNKDINASSEVWNFLKKYSLEFASVDGESTVKEYFNISVYPNPVKQYATVEISGKGSGTGTLIVYDITGREVHRSTAPVPGRVLFERGNLPSGLYLAEFELNGNMARRRMVLD